VLLDLQPLVQQTQAVIEADLSCCPTISFSAKNLRSVVYNLLSNALKYHHPDRLPYVRIACTLEAGWLRLSVQDNGLGLDLKRQKELFGMFRRFHPHVDGSGIGLYMVKRVVENAGGRIEVESAPNQGSTFTVYLPHQQAFA
jgi:signal transduction histidine kinase